MAEPDRKPVTLEELLVSSLAQTDALAKILVEQSLTTPNGVNGKHFNAVCLRYRKGSGKFPIENSRE